MNNIPIYMAIEYCPKVANSATGRHRVESCTGNPQVAGSRCQYYQGLVDGEGGLGCVVCSHPVKK